jgi:hypothetical protein
VMQKVQAEHLAGEESTAAEHAAAQAAKQCEIEEIAAKVSKLQAIVDESAAAHKAHAELKEHRIHSKCAAS